ncbi:MAG: hypothetical protein ACR2LK_06370 [Solirubrobacteraceae bacterium]
MLAPAAHASPQQTSIMQDDDLLLYRDDDTAARALAQMKKLGVDTVRVTVLWKNVAENARLSAREIKRKKLTGKFKRAARRQARQFKGSDPSTYPERNWDRYDNLVRSAKQNGIRVYFNVTGPGPAFAMRKPPRRLRKFADTWKPKLGHYRQFVAAVGKRYNGSYEDENADGSKLPRVGIWSLWNEPNQAGWLAPQWEKRNGRMVAASPGMYRKLFQFGSRGLRASGHNVDRDIILMGETAPLGSSRKSAKSPMRPGRFLRELGCFGSNGKKYRGKSGRIRDCNDFAKRGSLKANGYAHHPYTKDLPPTVADKHPDSLTMANIDDLGRLLDRVSAKTGGGIPDDLDLFMTEFGYETKPPDPFSGVPLPDQAKFNTIGEFEAWKNPRIRSQSQFLLRDVAPVRKHRKNSKAYWFTYQSGLFHLSGAEKPAARAYALPFLAFDRNTVNPVTQTPMFNFWGQMRLLPNESTASATIQWRPKDDTSPWRSVGPPVPLDPMGYFEAIRTAPGNGNAEWRSAIVLPDGTVAAASPGTTGDKVP